jgi:NADH-quinone oxidoreductase subunit G
VLNVAADKLIEARNLVIFYGSEGLTFDQSDSVARLLGNLLLVKKTSDGNGQHSGRRNNGLIPVWPRANTQGAFDMGVSPLFGSGYEILPKPGLDQPAILAGIASGDVNTLYLLGADPIGDGLMKNRDQLDFLIVQELFLTETAKVADIVLPAQSWAEREGTFTNGERRVQRFYPAIPQVGDSRPDWQILAQIGERVGLGKPPFASSLVFREISENVPQYSNMDYRGLAWTEEQWPLVGGDDLYYGGTSYRNESGLGSQWVTAAETEDIEQFEVPAADLEQPDGLVSISLPALYTPNTLISKSDIVGPRLAQPTVYLSIQDAEELSIADGEQVSLAVNGSEAIFQANVNGETPAGVAWLKGAAHQPAMAPLEIKKKA